MTRTRKPRAAKPAPWQPPPRKKRKDAGSKRWFWPSSQAQLDAWRAKRAADYAAANPEQLDMFRDALAALDAAEGVQQTHPDATRAHRQWLDRVRPKPPRRRPQR